MQKRYSNPVAAHRSTRSLAEAKGGALAPLDTPPPPHLLLLLHHLTPPSI